ncbi:Lactation elevated protein 1 [Nowakowskiella sp. JEL0407]|nr:Lactation elevated protein 1 [Nowakowskiella sp. JEL0407]
MQRIHGRIHSLRQQHHTSDPIPIIAQEIANKSWVLCFDELQVTDITDAMLLRRLFQELIDAGVVLVTTSNRPPDDLYKNGIQRKSFLPTIELLKNSCKVVELSGGVDYRKRSKEHMKVYFHPLSAESNNAIDTIWRRLTYQLEVAPLTLNYLGRSKTFQETAGGQILRITFAELCAQPASAADYLQLANQFQVVILTKIPQMNNLARNESRRFITLLDSLYENRRVLICEADKSMSELFDSGVEEGDVMTEEAFAFQRALSRLVEMQSMEWIGKEIMDRLDSPLV